MRKTTFLLILIAIIFVSCSSSDNEGSPSLAKRIDGSWYFDAIVKPNGDIIPFPEFGCTMRDYVDIYLSNITYSSINYYFSRFDTCAHDSFVCSNYPGPINSIVFDNQSGKLQNTQFLFCDGTITLSEDGKKMRIEYDQTLQSPFQGINSIDVHNVKAMLFSRTDFDQ